ncbi:hypothetical protein BDB00DRAFT_267683 [Zychaea mexicana]|uniref:uncharacterized protein n=1 Tax=Zychaea mexicana TaxID=64656 RepID=UPI0022FF1FCB|nr:uncharacterized protein BDB00DRAFT_267683 [Zychaea mexicana]KAI9495043.1 hypothetical protein BDB00DRAFT_267683 [Zychaea mexicana]
MAGDEPVINFVIGVFVSLGASFLDALGLNLLKLDHVKESQKSPSEQRSDCGRPLWHIGLYTYIASQLIGSTIALNYLKTQWVAPLGSVALIYNFLFAKILVGTKITRKDVLGTCVVVASVIWIVVFGGMYNGDDPEDTISLENLKMLFTRPIFIIYFSALNIITFSGLIFAIWSRWVLADDSRKRNSQLFLNMKPKQMLRIVGLMFSLEGGMLASETLLLAKSGVKLFTLSVNSQVNQFTDNTSRFILLALLITAILQVYCLNTALKLYSSVVVVPVFYGTYTALGLVNTIIYLDEIGNYPGWAIALVFIGIGVLIYGVFLLSSKPDPSSRHPDDEDDDEERREQPDPRQSGSYCPGGGGGTLGGSGTSGSGGVGLGGARGGAGASSMQERATANDTMQNEEMQTIHHNKSWPSAHDEKNQHERLQGFFAASSPSLAIPPPPPPPPVTATAISVTVAAEELPPAIVQPVITEPQPSFSRADHQQQQQQQQHHQRWWNRFTFQKGQQRRQHQQQKQQAEASAGSPEMAMHSLRRRTAMENNDTSSSSAPQRASSSNIEIPHTIIKVKP